MLYAAISSWCETLVWVLTHSLWQGAVIAGALWLMLRWLPARRAERRYAAALLGLAAIVLSAFVTWSVLRLEPTAQPVHLSGLRVESFPEHPPAVESGGVAAAAVDGTTPRRAWTTWLAAVWLVGAGVMLARALAGLLQAHSLAGANGGLSAFDLNVLEGLAKELCQRLGLKRTVQLIVSDHIRVPAVLGTLWPCVLLPAAMLSGVPAEQWRIMLAHELAHIRRHDALVNLAQLLIEALWFFNPAVWWLSRQVRIEREACCDALAAAVCGPPLSVARTLVEVAASIQQPVRSLDEPGSEMPKHAPASASILAMADPARQGELTDRVQRLVDPDRAARPRVSWLGLAAVLLALLLAGAALQQGTDLAVRAAAELMSPKERVDRLARLHAETNGVFLPPATGPASQGTAATPVRKGVPAASDPNDEMLKVTVVVRTEDGRPIPRDLRLTSLSATGNSSTATGLDGPRKEVPEYRRTLTFPPCRLRVGATAGGFAATVSPLVNLFGGDPERTIELVLKRGSRATLRVTNEQRRLIAGAELKATARVSIGGSASGLETRTFKADAQGVILLDQIGEAEYDQELRAAGFQRADRVGVLDVAAPMAWQLKPARPTRVRVIDAATGAPVAQARFELAHWQRSNHSSSHGDPRRRQTSSWLTYAQTDSEGRANLNELRDGTSYVFGILAAGYGMALLEDVQGGQPERVVKLSPPLRLAGRVIGPLDRLPQRGRKGAMERYLGYSTRLTNHVSDSGSVTVDAEGRFEITSLVAGERVTVSVLGRSQDFVVKDSRLDLELNLAEPAAAARPFPKRDVVLRLVGTAPGAAARGTLYVDWRHADPNCREVHNGPLPLRDNEIRMSIPVGARLSFFPQSLAGYVIERQDDVEITAGAEPQIIAVPARPAGGIHGTVVRADGRPATTAFVTVFASKLPPGIADHRRINSDTASGSSSFLLTLPLGGRYRVLARELIDAHNVWTVSDEITLDDNQPIAEVRLSLPAGQSLPIKVLDPDGRPVVDQPVQLELGFSQENGYSFSTHLVRQTGADGVALFENLSLDTRIRPLQLALHVQIPPNRFMGWHGTFDPLLPVEIRLQRGLSASGVVLEAETGKPIPRAEVRLVPRDYGRAQFKGIIHTRTNERGEFHFGGLEDQEYTGYVHGSAPKGTVITQEGGNTRFHYPPGVTPHSLRAGSSNVRWEVQIYPGSSLKATD